MKAIETRYKGYRFRSRLEARWAVFFDALGVRYRYEPEGFSLPSGPYLPDFFLPDQKVWIEIKPGCANATPLDSPERTKCFELAEATRSIVVMLFECEPLRFMGDAGFEGNGIYFSPVKREWDGLISFGWCNQCDRPTLGQLGGHKMYCSLDLEPDFRDEFKSHNPSNNNLRVQRAFTAARSARFEHGETPTIGDRR